MESATGSLVLSSAGSAPAIRRDVSVAVSAEPGSESAVPTKEALTSLALHVRKTFERNADHRRNSGVDERLMKCLRMVKREYSPSELADLQARGVPAIYMPIADTKRRAAMSLVGEIFANPGDKPWTLRPTPVPSVPDEVVEAAVTETMADWVEYVTAGLGEPPPEDAVMTYAAGKVDEIFNSVMQSAKERAERMERKVHDQMVEGGWLDAFQDYTDMVSTYGTALMLGPVPRVRRRKKAVKSKSGVLRYEVSDALVLEFEAVSPWDSFPSPGAKRAEDGALCLRSRFTPEDLRRYAKSQGRGTWKAEVVDSILDRYPNGGVRVALPNDIERRRLESDGVNTAGDDCIVEGIRFYGEVRGSYLAEMGVNVTSDGRMVEAESYYDVEAITIDDKVVFCRVIDEELGRPVTKGVFYKEPGSWWGESPVEKMEGTQKICNAAVRDLIVNMAQASGPQTVITDVERLVEGQSLSQSPWKVWLFHRGAMGTSEVPMKPFQPDSNAGELLKVFEWGMKQADLDTGIPAYTYGSNIAAGAGRTASGLAMLTEAASRGIKMVVGQTDMSVIRRQVRMTCDWNMLYDDDDSIKGDVDVNPSGVMGLILREQESNRRRAFLQLTANPLDSQIVTAEGRAAILREEVKSLGVNPDEVLPSKAKLREIDAMREAKERMAMEQESARQEAEGQPAQEGGGLPGQAQVDYVRQHPQQRAVNGLRLKSQRNTGGEF